MRAPASRERLIAFMRRLGREPGARGRVYLTGGATAVLEGWRDTTVDIDLDLDADAERVLKALPAIKEELHVNVELAAPHHFLPPLPGWQERSRFIRSEGQMHFFHYDPYGQALAKIERGHAQDVADVAAMLAAGLIDPSELRRLHACIEAELYRFPAVDPPTLRQKLDEALTR
jgi:hypothetical protein